MYDKEFLFCWLCKCWIFWWKSKFMIHKIISNDNWAELRMMDRRTIWPNVTQNQIYIKKNKKRFALIVHEGLHHAEEFYLFILRITDSQNLRSTQYTSRPLSVSLLLPLKSRVPFSRETNFRNVTFYFRNEERKDYLERLLPNLL